MKTKISLAAFLAASALPESLVRATVKQVGGWEEFTDSASDVASYGAAGGFPGFTYYTDTVAFYQANRRDILAALGEMAESLGESGALSVVKGFTCLSDATEEEIGQTLYGSPEDQDQQVANALAWYALEETARAYVDALEA